MSQPRLASIKIPVRDLDAAIAFYGALAGMTVVSRLHSDHADEAVLMQAGGGFSLTLVRAAPDGDEMPITLLFLDDDAAAFAEALSAAGGAVVTPPTRVSAGGFESVLVFGTDRDGHMIEGAQLTRRPEPR